MRGLILALAVWALPSAALAQVGGGGLPDELPGLENAPAFVADLVITNAQVRNATYRLYYEPGKMRMESLAGTPDGDKQIIISDLTRKITYCDVGGMWLKIPQNALGAEDLDYGSTPHFRTHKLGRKVIDGKSCTGVRLESPDGNTVIEQWMWGDYPVLATIHDSMGVTTARYLSLRPADTPESYFEVPAGAQVQDMGGGAAGMSGQMPGGLPQGLPGGSDPNADLQKLLDQ